MKDGICPYMYSMINNKNLDNVSREIKGTIESHDWSFSNAIYGYHFTLVRAKNTNPLNEFFYFPYNKQQFVMMVAHDYQF